MSDFRSYRTDAMPPIVKNLMIINALVFVAQLVFVGDVFNATQWLQIYPVMPEELRVILEREGHRQYTNGQQFYPYQIATHMFAHSGISHIVFNMFGLWMFGKKLENVWGPQRFLLFYFLCGIGAAICDLIIGHFRCVELLNAIKANEPDISNLVGAVSPALGASGAIMGIFAAYAYLFPNTEMSLLFIPVPVKAKWLVLGMVLSDLFGGFSNAPGDNVGHFAHLGGALTGFILVLIWNKTGRKRFY